MTHEVNSLMSEYQNDDSIGAIVLTGSEKFFASGADILEMSEIKYPESYYAEVLHHWEYITTIQKPIIGAVNGWVLGGGCIYALICDILLAGSRTKMGIPAIKLGIVAGGSGTQRLPKIVGKYISNELLLTGLPINAYQAKEVGLVSQVYEPGQVLNEAVKLGNRISKNEKYLNTMAKESVYNTYEVPLSESIAMSRQL